MNFDIEAPKIFNLNMHYVAIYFIVIFILGSIIGISHNISRKPKERSKQRSISRKSIKSKLTDEELMRADIDTLSGTDFERLVAMYYRDHGYQVQQVGGSGDHEVDLILKGKDGYKIAVQCKRWKKDVGNDIVLRLKAGKQIYGCHDAWVITTSHFTKAAQEAAEKLNIQLINGAMIKDKLVRWRKNKIKAK